MHAFLLSSSVTTIEKKYLQDLRTPVIKDDDLNLTEVDLQDPCTYF
jgi:hypothetical protein